jgi:uncharacterized protein (PEP-CTERM system associated)
LRSNADWAVLGGVLLQLVGGVMAASASAGEFRLTPSILIEEGVTDNARQGQGGGGIAAGGSSGSGQADLFTRVQPSISLSSIGGRVRLNLNYAYRHVFYMDNSDLDSDSHNLAHTGTAELIDELLFVDTRASMSEALINNTGAESADINLTNQANRTSVRSVSVAPYIRNHLGDFANTEFRYTFGLTDSSGLSGSISHRSTSTLKSGDRFQRLKWTLTADIQHADRTRSPGTGGTLLGAGQDSTSNTKLFQAEGEYRLSNDWALTGSGGYEETRDTTLVQDLDGPIGSVGFKYTPSPRLTAAASFNHRNKSEFGRGNLNYKITERATLDLSYDETLQISENQRLRNLDFLTVDQFGNFVDSRTADAFQLNNNTFGLNDNVVRRKTAAVRFNLISGRDTYGAEFRQERQITESTGVEQESMSIAGNWARVISDQDRVNLTLRFRTLDTGGGGAATTPRTDHQENLNVSYTHNFTPDLSGVVTYSLLARQSDAPNADLIENVLVVGVRKQF